MRYKMFALILALTVATWAQTSTQTTPAAPQPSTVPADKAMCDKMAAGDSKDAHSCCAHQDMKSDMEAEPGKATASCCSRKDMKSSDGKDAMSCMKGNKDKTAAACCKDGCGKDSCAKAKTASACCGGKCAKDGEKGCGSGMKREKTAKSCCAKELHS